MIFAGLATTFLELPLPRDPLDQLEPGTVVQYYGVGIAEMMDWYQRELNVRWGRALGATHMST